MTADGRKALVACAVMPDGTVEACEPEVLARVRAIAKARELGVDPTPLIRRTEQIMDVHLQELKGREPSRRRQR